MEDKWVSDFTDFMRVMKQRIESDILPVKTKQMYEEGVLPSLRSVGTTVELRGVFDKVYRSGTPLENYSPELKSITPVISIIISVTRGDPKEFMFQATPREIDSLIDHFEAAKKRAEILQQSHSN